MLELNFLVSKNQAAKIQAYLVVLIAPLLGLGVAKVLVGISRGKPTVFLIFLCFIVALIGFFFWVTPPYRSRYGDRVLQDLRTRIHSTAVSHTDPQLPLVFALWGMEILPNDVFADLKKVFTPASSGDSSDVGTSGGDDGGGGDGGGGDGGGCGGCGGGD